MCLNSNGGLWGLAWITERLCIEVTSVSKIAFISEELCTGCGICVKVLLLEILLLCCKLVGVLFM